MFGKRYFWQYKSRENVTYLPSGQGCTTLNDVVRSKTSFAMSFGTAIGDTWRHEIKLQWTIIYVSMSLYCFIKPKQKNSCDRLYRFLCLSTNRILRMVTCRTFEEFISETYKKKIFRRIFKLIDVLFYLTSLLHKCI